MVLNKVRRCAGRANAFRPEGGMCTAHVRGIRSARDEITPLGRAHRSPDELGCQVDFGIAGDGDVVWLLSFQTRPCRKYRQSRPVLHAIKTLFFHGAHELAIPKHSSGRVTVECVNAQNNQVETP